MLQATHKKMQILSDVDSSTEKRESGPEKADEFLRNFFIKFGMKKTLESFQTEWYELKAKGDLDVSQMPKIPAVYSQN